MIRLTEEQIATLSREARRAAVAVHRKYSVPLDDLKQEAWAAMLAVVPAYRAEGGPFGAYLYAVALSACQRYAWKAAALTSAPRRKAAAVIAGQQATSADTAARDDALVPTPFDALDSTERQRALSALIGEHLAEGEEGRAVFAALLGEVPFSEVAQAAGMTVRRLYRLTYRTRSTIRADKRFRDFL